MLMEKEILRSLKNPGTTNVKVTIEGVANKVFVEGMRTLDQWKEAEIFYE